MRFRTRKPVLPRVRPRICGTCRLCFCWRWCCGVRSGFCGDDGVWYEGALAGRDSSPAADVHVGLLEERVLEDPAQRAPRPGGPPHMVSLLTTDNSAYS